MKLTPDRSRLGWVSHFTQSLAIPNYGPSVQQDEIGLHLVLGLWNSSVVCVKNVFSAGLLAWN